MAVPSVFISSVIRGIEPIREAAAAAVRAMGMYPIVSEEAAATAASPRRALLDEVDNCDYYVLLLGERYGDSGPDEKSPTEDEYDRAVAQGKPLLVLVQDVELEPRQQDFLDRVRGSWGEGVLYSRFKGEEDVGTQIAAALGKARSGIGEDVPGAQAEAAELARGPDSRNSIGSGVEARVAYVPTRRSTLLDALTLEDRALADDLAAALRDAGAVSQQIGIESEVSSAGVQLRGSNSSSWTTPTAVITAEGAVVVTGSVAPTDAPMGFGGSLVDPDELERFISAAGRFAQLAWQRIDRQGEVGQVAMAVAIPNAEHKGFGKVTGNSMSIPMTMPPTVLAPDPALVLPHGQVADASAVRRLGAEIRRVFADAGAVQS